ACTVYESLGKTTQSAGVLNNIGTIYMGLGENRKALEYSMKSLSLQKTDEDRALYSYTLNSIGVCYQRLGEYDRSLQYLQQSLKIKQTLGVSDSIGNSFMNIGVVYQDSSDYNTANEYFQKALAIFEPTGNIGQKCLVLLNIGVNHIHFNEHEQARKVLLESLDLAAKLGNTSLIAEVSLPLGNLMRLAGDFENAIEHYEQALLVARDTGNKDLTRKINKILAECWKESGNPKRALECFRIFTQLDNELNHYYSRITINTMLVGFETTAERQQQEIAKLKTENLFQELENKNRNLEAIAREMLKKQKMLRTLRDEIELRKLTAPSATQKKLNHLLDHIITHDAGASGWQALEQRFKHQFPEFSSLLTSRYPRLSQVEVKVCCLLKIGLITKEIADLLFLSERTIDFHRTSIRKKIGLDSKENLMQFFNG
ncbi:MAG: LuxR family transcriptional regulator, partial [Ignavibacteriae bacterium]|nr:LuxR family transcriptional regulator [Ignavibacteriota bacterium]